MVPVLALTMAGCTGSAVRPGQPTRASGPSGQSATASTAQQRFSVLLSTQARQLASSAGVGLSQLVASALTHINALLPGPPTVIVVQTGNPSQLIPQVGTNGFTRPSGQVILQVGRTAQSTLPRTLHLWLPRDLAHEVNHSVRNVSWAQLTAASATAILAASHYQPCPPPGSG